MSFPFDATLKDIVGSHTADFEDQLRLRRSGPAALLNVDLSTVTAATDIALGYGDPVEEVVDLNFQAGRDADLVRRLLLYAALLHHRFAVPVHTLLILLRPAADHDGLTGKLRYQSSNRRGTIHFTYEVVRLWQKPVRRFLKGGLGTLPLAPLCQLPAGVALEDGLADVIRQIDRRLQREATREEAARLISAAYVLTGLRVERETAAQLFSGVQTMRESTTYQAILDEGRAEGRAEGACKVLLKQGRFRFGPPNQAILTALGAIHDMERLERLSQALLVVSSWQELLATP